MPVDQSEFRESASREANTTLSGDPPILESASGHCSDYQEGFHAAGHGFGKVGIRRLIGEILLAREEPDHRAALARGGVSKCPAQGRMGGLERVQHRPLCGRAVHLDLDDRANACQCP